MTMVKSQLELALKPAPASRPRSSCGAASSVPNSTVTSSTTTTTKGGVVQRVMDEHGISLNLTKLEQIRFKRRIIEFIVDNHLSFKIVERETFISLIETKLDQIRFKRRIIEFIVDNHLSFKIVESETFISLMVSIRKRQCSTPWTSWSRYEPQTQTTGLQNSNNSTRIWPSCFVQTASWTKSNCLGVYSKGPMMPLSIGSCSIEWSILVWPILVYTCLLLRFSLLLASTSI
jgi:hypothetical protein